MAGRHRASRRSGMRVLIVEDEMKMAGLLRRGFRNEGIAVDLAERGEDAVWMAEATDYDAIVLDVMLPGINGFEVCRRLRADGVRSPVLMLTARDAVRDRVEHRRLLREVSSRQDRPAVRDRLDRDRARRRLPAARLKRLPIRLRVTLAFAGATAVLLVALGLFIYLRFESRLDGTINQNLRTRASEVAHLLLRAGRAGGPANALLVEGEESFAQALTLAGRPIAPKTGPAAAAPLIRGSTLAEARRHPLFVDDTTVPLSHDQVRLFAERAELANGPAIIVSGVPLDDRHDTLANLRDLLLVGGAAALVIASLVGYAAVAAALRPVEAMRRRAAEISAAEPDEALPVGPARDELARLGETLNAMLARIHDALERERRFLDDASHELRTPLALHKTELEIALRYGTDPNELRASIASAIEEADRLAELAEDLLVVAPSEDGALDLPLEPVQLPPPLQELRERFRSRAGADRRAVAVDADGAWEVEADRQRLERALINMVDNAFRHGGGEVTLRAARRDGRIELHVADRGPGFPPEFLDRAFERFSRADPARRRGGTGLGLAIVDRIARAHGGRAHAVNRAGGGADVWIELPSRPA